MSNYINDYMNWNDEIEKDSSEFEIAPEGEYSFEVVKFERQRTEAESKYPNCNKAVLSLRLIGSEGDEYMVQDSLILNKSLEWKLSQFFCAIGQKKRGEKMHMNWQAVTGSTGRCKVTIRTWRRKDDAPGEETGRSNNIKYHDPESAAAAPAKSYTKGTF